MLYERVATRNWRWRLAGIRRATMEGTAARGGSKPTMQSMAPRGDRALRLAEPRARAPAASATEFRVSAQAPSPWPPPRHRRDSDQRQSSRTYRRRATSRARYGRPRPQHLPCGHHRKVTTLGPRHNNLPPGNDCFVRARWCEQRVDRCDGLASACQPLPTNGISVAITVSDSTLAPKGSPAM
jgi:hypothetical protein